MFFYKRIQIDKGDTIFTTTSYVRSAKRVNYCALLKNGSFFVIDNFVWVEGAYKHCEVFIFGHTLGTVSFETYSPFPIGSKQFMNIPGQTAKVVGMNENLEIVLPTEIERKCVVASHNNQLFPVSYILTALPNTLETD